MKKLNTPTRKIIRNGLVLNDVMPKSARFVILPSENFDFPAMRFCLSY